MSACPSQMESHFRIQSNSVHLSRAGPSTGERVTNLQVSSGSASNKRIGQLIRLNMIWWHPVYLRCQQGAPTSNDHGDHCIPQGRWRNTHPPNTDLVSLWFSKLHRETGQSLPATQIPPRGFTVLVTEGGGNRSHFD